MMAYFFRLNHATVLIKQSSVFPKGKEFIFVAQNNAGNKSIKSGDRAQYLLIIIVKMSICHCFFDFFNFSPLIQNCIAIFKYSVFSVFLTSQLIRYKYIYCYENIYVMRSSIFRNHILVAVSGNFVLFHGNNKILSVLNNRFYVC